jgi:hypothetical protein
MKEAKELKEQPGGGDKDKVRDLEVLARAKCRIAQALWAERHVRLAADISTDVALAMAAEVHDNAVVDRENVWDDLAWRCNKPRPRASVWAGPEPVPEEWLPVIPAVPQPKAGDFVTANTERMQKAYVARDEAARHLMRAEDQLRHVQALLRAGHERRPKDWRDHPELLAARQELQAGKDALVAASDYVTRVRIEEYGTDEAVEACTPRTVRTRMRAVMSETDAWVGGILGLVGGPKRLGLPAMVTDWTLERAQEQARLNAEMLATTVFVLRDANGCVVLDDEGKPIVRAADEAAAARLHARKSRNYAICKAMQGCGAKYGYVLVLLTTTLPGPYHYNPAKAKRRPDLAISPTQAKKELQKRNHNALALAQSRGCRFIAPRSREGQTDGTPHDHVAAFVHPDDLERVVS